MLQKIQRFGGAMMGPVMLMIFSSILIGLASIFTNGTIMGSLAADTGNWYKVWMLIYDAGYAVFAQLPLMFVVSLPLKLANKSTISMKNNKIDNSFVSFFVIAESFFREYLVQTGFV